MVDKTGFLKSFEGQRLKTILAYCEKKTDWFPYQELFDYSVEQSKIYKRATGRPHTQGTPSRTRSFIVYLIRIGYLLADPTLGLKVNPEFVPKK